MKTMMKKTMLTTMKATMKTIPKLMLMAIHDIGDVVGNDYSGKKQRTIIVKTRRTVKDGTMWPSINCAGHFQIQNLILGKPNHKARYQILSRI
jgi:hypothetical protein